MHWFLFPSLSLSLSLSGVVWQLTVAYVFSVYFLEVPCCSVLSWPVALICQLPMQVLVDLLQDILCNLASQKTNSCLTGLFHCRLLRLVSALIFCYEPNKILKINWEFNLFHATPSDWIALAISPFKNWVFISTSIQPLMLNLLYFLLGLQ